MKLLILNLSDLNYNETTSFDLLTKGLSGKLHNKTWNNKIRIYQR
jgi:hypothetical protein